MVSSFKRNIKMLVISSMSNSCNQSSSLLPLLLEVPHHDDKASYKNPKNLWNSFFLLFGVLLGNQGFGICMSRTGTLSPGRDIDTHTGAQRCAKQHAEATLQMERLSVYPLLASVQQTLPHSFGCVCVRFACRSTTNIAHTALCQTFKVWALNIKEITKE